MRLWLKRAIYLLVLVLIVAVLVYALRPAPVEVDAATVVRGPIEVSVNEEGRTRVRDRYIVAAPLAGTLGRVELKAGDAVSAGDVLASIRPARPQLLDDRQLAEAQARVEAAAAAVERAAMLRERSAAEVEWAQAEMQRIAALPAAAAGQRERDDARFLHQVRLRELEAARWAERISRHELELAEAALSAHPRGMVNGESVSGSPDSPTHQLTTHQLYSPVDGQVLRVMQESESPVQAGAAILEIGQVRDLEVVMDVLSREAVRISVGDPVRLIRWGGDEQLSAIVRRIEPSAFTKVSALGVEEQRVNVIADIVEAPPQLRLGDRFRVDAQVIVQRRADVLKVPIGALLRHGEGWAVFAIVAEVATLRPIRIGLRGDLEAEVIEGLSEDDRVIIYPSDQVRDGVRVVER